MNQRKTKSKSYVAPKVEIIAMENQSVLCGSGMRGGTETMIMQDINVTFP